jgi:methionyl-tRNA synthetase
MNNDLTNIDLFSFLTENPWFSLLIIWSIFWKVIALWKSARNNHLTFFLVIFFINTCGLAEIIYLWWLKNKKKNTV